MNDDEKKRLEDYLKEDPRDQQAADRLYRMEIREHEVVLRSTRFHFRGYRISGGREGYVYWRDYDSRGTGGARPAGELRDCTCIRITGDG